MIKAHRFFDKGLIFEEATVSPVSVRNAELLEGCNNARVLAQQAT